MLRTQVMYTLIVIDNVCIWYFVGFNVGNAYGRMDTLKSTRGGNDSCVAVCVGKWIHAGKWINSENKNNTFARKRHETRCPPVVPRVVNPGRSRKAMHESLRNVVQQYLAHSLQGKVYDPARVSR